MKLAPALLGVALVSVVWASACAPYHIPKVPDAGDLSGVGGGSNDGGADGGRRRTDIDDRWLGEGTYVCADEVRKISLRPLDLLVVLDVSYSMDYDEKWTAVKSAMKNFVSRDEFLGLGVGLQYFPLRDQCDVAGYSSPAVAIGVLPAVAPAIANSLDQQAMSGGTPTVQALEGAAAYAKLWQTVHPDREAAIVLATDGFPDGTCAGATASGGLPNNLANVLTVASAALNSSPSVTTFVIGVGQGLEPLNNIAIAGGSDNAIFVDNSPQADVKFLQALMQIRRTALGCEFTIPASALDDRAQITFAPDDGSPPFLVEPVANKASCVNGEGWYLDDPVDATKAVFCDGTCNYLTTAQIGDLRVQFACGVN